MSNRKKPTYDWEWFESHTPFKSTLEKMCNLTIEHEAQRVPTIAGYWTTNHHYKIRFNGALFERDFDKIKEKLLNTNICKNNRDVYEFVAEQTCCKRSFGNLIMYGCGCYKYHGGSFEWDDMTGETK
jgi:hypothetical protein